MVVAFDLHRALRGDVDELQHGLFWPTIISLLAEQMVLRIAVRQNKSSHSCSNAEPKSGKLYQAQRALLADGVLISPVQQRCCIWTAHAEDSELQQACMFTRMLMYHDLCNTHQPARTRAHIPQELSLPPRHVMSRLHLGLVKM